MRLWTMAIDPWGCRSGQGVGWVLYATLRGQQQLPHQLQTPRMLTDHAASMASVLLHLPRAFKGTAFGRKFAVDGL